MIFEICPYIVFQAEKTRDKINRAIEYDKKRRFYKSDDDVPKPTIPDIIRDFELAKSDPSIKFMYYNRFYKIT